MPMPKRMRSTRSSRGVSEASTRVVVSRRLDWIAASIFELIDRLHQADIAFLDEVEELQAAVGVLLRDRDHETEVGFHHLLLGLTGLALALLHGVHDLAELDDLQTRKRGQRLHLVAQILDAVLVVMDEVLPAF